jgi:hypothetical protein
MSSFNSSTVSHGNGTSPPLHIASDAPHYYLCLETTGWKGCRLNLGHLSLGPWIQHFYRIRIESHGLIQCQRLTFRLNVGHLLIQATGQNWSLILLESSPASVDITSSPPYVKDQIRISTMSFFIFYIKPLLTQPDAWPVPLSLFINSGKILSHRV